MNKIFNINESEIRLSKIGQYEFFEHNVNQVLNKQDGDVFDRKNLVRSSYKRQNSETGIIDFNKLEMQYQKIKDEKF